MKKQVLSILVAVMMVVAVSQSCKKSDVDEIIRYTLTVIKAAGISGSPDAGTYTYDQNTQVNYDYSVEQGYTNTCVKIDGQNAALNGTVTMNANHRVEVSCDEIDYSGTWSTTYKWTKGDCDPDDGKNEKATITHNGDVLTILIHSEGLEFEGTVDKNGDFEATVDDWVTSNALRKYKVTGTFTSPTEFEGTLEAEGYYKGKKVCTSTGTVTGTKN